MKYGSTTLQFEANDISRSMKDSRQGRFYAETDDIGSYTTTFNPSYIETHIAPPNIYIDGRQVQTTIHSRCEVLGR